MRDGVELNRLDVKNRTPTPAPLIAKVLKQLDRHWSRVDAWIVLDQVSEADCGVVTAAVREHVADRAKSDLKRFVLADSRERIAEFRHVSIKPNRREFEQLGERSTETAPFIFATDGERGIDLQCRETPGERTHIPAYPVNGPTDIVGAGDSTSAGIVCAICSGMNAAQAAAFGNLVASITVQQIGTTGTATPQQVRDRWNTVMSSD
jgi:sugar/nucleoside kinase (ribokinase family)